ncbi:MAG: DUF4010 domain-containing protein, partial [Promethearchaeota archaeon]
LLAIIISVIFLIILSSKKQFHKIRKLQAIEWTGTIEFISICLLLIILFPNNIIIARINIKAIIIIFITILAVKYFSYFLLKSSVENNLYYISFLGGLAHSEATTLELAEAGASSSSIWLVIQTMLIRMLLILILAPILLYYALYPIGITVAVGLVGSFLILRKKETSLKLEKIKNPLSLKGALIFAGTYSLFVTTAYLGGQVDEAQALIMLVIGLSGAIFNKVFYSLRVLDENKNKKVYSIHLITYLLITVITLITMTILTIIIFGL